MTPEEMAEAAIQSGLDGVVITEHDVLWPVDEVAALQAKFPALRILRGVEVSTAQGHMLVYGIADGRGFYQGMQVDELAEQVHQEGGIVVMAHPCRYSDDIPEEIYSAGIDGVEALGTNVRAYMQDGIRRIQERLQIPGVAGTDAHVAEMLGVFATDFDDDIETERDLAVAVRTRAFTLYRNQRRIDGINAGVDGRIAHLKRVWEQERHLSRKDIKTKYGFTYSFQYGVKNGKDMRLI
jgi:predicted metal-dependent phosphoesterase TrpH